MKAEVAIQIICPNCLTGAVLSNPPAGTWPRIASCACGFNCLVPTIEVTPCDRDGNEFPEGINTEDQLWLRIAREGT